MNPGSRDTPTEEKTQRLSSGNGHGHSKAGSSIVMHDHGRHSPASAHSPGVSGKLPGLHPDSSRQTRGFSTPGFSAAGLPGFNLEHHLPFLFSSASSLLFPPFIHPSSGPLFPPVLPPNFLAPPPLANLFPSPNAECEAPSSGWSAHSGGSRNTSSLGSSSSEGDTAAKIDGRTVRSSRFSPDLNLQPTSLSSSVCKIWENTVIDPVCISDADMPLSLVTRRETTSRGSSAAESGVCTGDSVARAASTETSRTPSLDGESGCQLISENSGPIQEQTVCTVSADQLAQRPAVNTDRIQIPSVADDGKSTTGDDVWSSTAAASRSSGIALPPRKRLTRNAEELQSSAVGHSAASPGTASSPSSSAPNFRSCWKKFAAKSNVSAPPSHRAFGGKPQYDCRTYFQKLAEQHKAAAASKAFVPGKGKGHCYRNASKSSPRSSDQNTGSPRVTRSQSKPKKTQSPKSSPTEPPAPVRKSTRKKSINTRFEEYDRTTGKNKKSKSSSSDSNAAPASDAGKETSQAGGDEATSTAEKNSQHKNRRRGKQDMGDVSSGICAADNEDSTSQSQLLTTDVLHPASDRDSKPFSSCLPPAKHEGSDLNARMEDTVEPEPSLIITLLPPKFRHFKTKTATANTDSMQPQTNSEQPVTTPIESGNLEVANSSAKSDVTDSAAAVVQSKNVGDEERDSRSNLSSLTSPEDDTPLESSVNALAAESKVSQSHSIDIRKRLLYRSSATVDSQPATEAKVSLITSQTECSMPVSTEVASAASVNQIPADEKSDIKVGLLEDTSAPEHGSVLLEQNESLLNSTVLEGSSVERNEKAPGGVSGTHSEQHVDAVSNKSSDVISCKPPSPGTGDTDTKSGTVSAAVPAASDYLDASANEDSAQTAELDSGSENVDNNTQRLDGCQNLPADGLDECDSHHKVRPSEGTDISVTSGSESLESRSHSTDDGITSSSAVAEPISSTTVTVSEVVGLSCRTKPVDVGSNNTEESMHQSTEPLKRLLPPEDATVNDDAKRRRVDSVDHTGDRRLPADTDNQPGDSMSNITTTVNFISLSSDHDGQTCSVPNNKSYTVRAGKQSTILSTDIQSSSKPERLKPDRSKSTKANRRLKTNRSNRAVKTVIITQPPVLEKSNSTGETNPAESKSDRTGAKYEPPLLENSLDSSRVTPPSDTAAVTKYAVANSVDRCDTNADVSSQSCSEQKTLRISLVALNESNTTVLRVKNSRTETVHNSDKTSRASPTAAVHTAMTTTSGVNNLKQLMSDDSLADAEPQLTSAGCALSQESTLESDSSSLLSQCKSLSVVIEKMRNSSGSGITPPPASLVKPTSRRRKGGLAHRRSAPTAKREAPANDSLITADKPGPELSSLVDDEYSFPDDSLADDIPAQRVPRPERKTSSRKTRVSLPAPDLVEMSPAAVSDGSSRGATSSVDSSMASGSTGVRSATPNAIQKSLSHLESGNTRLRLRRHNVLEDEDTRSLSPFAQNGSSPAPVVEASLDGHKLKLRITKCTNRSVEASICDARVSVAPSPSVDFTDNKTKLKDAEVTAPDYEPPTTVEVSAQPVSRRRRQMKVEGVRSRFLTLHKPLGVVPSPDHVKCRLVKVGRRQWMSVGGEEGDDDDTSAAQPTDTETPTTNRPPVSSIDEMAQHPTRDRLLLVNVERKQHRRGRPPKVKATDLADANSLLIHAKRTRKRVKTDTSQFEIGSPKPEPLPEPVSHAASRTVRLDPVPWLDYETDGDETQPYCALGSSSSRTIATDIDEHRSDMSMPAELTSNIDLVISDALSDCGIEFAYNTILTPKFTFFVPSELERLMEALVLDDLHRQPCIHTPPTIASAEMRVLPPVSIDSSFSYSNSVALSVSSPRNNNEVDLLLSQQSLRLRNCTLPVNASDSSDYDCTVVGYEYPAYCYPESVEPPSAIDHQFVDDDFLLQLSCLTEPPPLYSCVDAAVL